MHALISQRAASVGDADIWWHLQTGEWITQHQAVPRVDLFSSATMGQPWQAYTWLFDLLTFHLFHRLSVAGIVIYNDYGWGGYLIWELRLPVSIDGRAALYGDDRINRSRATWDGEPNWASDPQLLSAGLIVAPVNTPLTQLLRLNPAFKLTHEDQQTALFVPDKSAPRR